MLSWSCRHVSTRLTQTNYHIRKDCMHTIIITLQPVTVNRMREERAEASRAESVSALLHADPHVLRAIPASAARAPASARGLHTTH